MSTMLKKCFIVAVATLTLTGCKKDLTYAYLMQHPKVLKREVIKCQALENTPQMKKSQCETVLYAAASFMSILDEQEENPELFGEKIMKVEGEYVQAKEAVANAKQTLLDLQNKNASGADINSAQIEVNKARELERAKKEEMKNMLAVVGVNSPE